jgi:hypothetical protein
MAVHIVFGEFQTVGVENFAGRTFPINAFASQILKPCEVSIPNPNSGTTLLSISIGNPSPSDIIFITGKNLTAAMLSDGVTPTRFYSPRSSFMDILVNGGDQFVFKYA